MVKNYCYLNNGLTIVFNGEKYFSENGLKDLLEETIHDDLEYPIIHLKGEDIEIALTHSKTQIAPFVCKWTEHHARGTHLAAYREAIVKPYVSFIIKVLRRQMYENLL
jgi:topoisomerase-4 subunit B